MLSAVTLPVAQPRPGARVKTGNREDSRFVRFLPRSAALSLVIHCEVLTSQVTSGQPDRDCPVIGRPASREPGRAGGGDGKKLLNSVGGPPDLSAGLRRRPARRPGRAGHGAVRW